MKLTGKEKVSVLLSGFAWGKSLCHGRDSVGGASV